jgi:hypothetical protein
MIRHATVSGKSFTTVMCRWCLLTSRLTKFVKIRIEMGLLCTRQQSHTVESIHDTMMSLRETYPNAGAQEMVSLLFHERAMSVSR